MIIFCLNYTLWMFVRRKVIMVAFVNTNVTSKMLLQYFNRLTDWPSEALSVSADYCPHTSALCFQEPIRPSWSKHQQINEALEKSWQHPCTFHLFRQKKPHLLLIPPTVMNKIFDLFILDVYLNTLKKEAKYNVKTLYYRDRRWSHDQIKSKAAYLSFVEQWPMKTQHSFTWTLFGS